MTVYTHKNKLRTSEFLTTILICLLGSLKLNCRRQIVCISLLVLNSFIRKRLTMKSTSSAEICSLLTLLIYRVKCVYRCGIIVQALSQQTTVAGHMSRNTTDCQFCHGSTYYLLSFVRRC